MTTKLCSRCKERPARGARGYCKVCHASYMRVYRRNNPTKVQVLKARIELLEKALQIVHDGLCCDHTPEGVAQVKHGIREVLKERP